MKRQLSNVISAFLLLILGLFSINQHVLAADQKPETKSDPLRIATMDLPPYGFVDNKGKKVGSLYDVVEEVAKRSGVPYVHEIQPFSRMLQSLKEGSVDVISSQAHQQALDAGEKLGIIYKINVIVATRKGSGIQTLDDLKGKNFVYHFSANYVQLEGIPRDIVRVKSYLQAMQMLRARPEIDAAVFSEPAYYYFMNEAGFQPNDFGKVLTLEKDKDQWIFVRHGLPQSTRDRLKKAVDEVNQENTFKKMSAKYSKYSANSDATRK